MSAIAPCTFAGHRFHDARTRTRGSFPARRAAHSSDVIGGGIPRHRPREPQRSSLARMRHPFAANGASTRHLVYFCELALSRTGHETFARLLRHVNATGDINRFQPPLTPPTPRGARRHVHLRAPLVQAHAARLKWSWRHGCRSWRDLGITKMKNATRLHGQRLISKIVDLSIFLFVDMF
jgi:hypothetical protein